MTSKSQNNELQNYLFCDLARRFILIYFWYWLN